MLKFKKEIIDKNKDVYDYPELAKFGFNHLPARDKFQYGFKKNYDCVDVYYDGEFSFSFDYADYDNMQELIELIYKLTKAGYLELEKENKGENKWKN